MTVHFKNQRQSLTRLLNVVHNHTQAGSKHSLPTPVSCHKDRQFCEIIDVRSPDEFMEDHVPGAINLPVLSNKEREIVGTKYSKDRFTARKLGAALISRNISQHIEQHFAPKQKGYSPLVYCWRGGQRSYSLGIILSQIGFETCVLDGGHKKYRLYVREGLKATPSQLSFRVISGMTGSGKTHILQALREKGQQVLDLEALAKHKGSVLGLWHHETQPSQKQWESHLLQDLEQFSSDKPVWVESESRKIGRVYVPDQLFLTMSHAPRFCVNLPLQERVKHIVHCYPNWIEESDYLKEVIGKILVRVTKKETVEVWLDMIDKQKWEEFVAHILVNHYDPTYAYSQKKNNISGLNVEEFCIPDLKEETVDNLVSSLIEKGNQAFEEDSIQISCS